MIQKAWQWLVYSSQDADKVSLFIKGLAGFIPSVVLVLSVIHINVSGDNLAGFLQALAVLVTIAGSVVTAIITVLGFVRKIVSTAIGQNEVVLGWRN